MIDFSTDESQVGKYRLVIVVIMILCFAICMLEDFNNTIFQYDNFGTVLYFSSVLITVILMIPITLFISLKAGVTGHSAFYCTIMLTGMVAFSCYLLQAPDYVLKTLPGFGAVETKKENIPVAYLSTTSFRGRFRHFVGLGSVRAGFGAKDFPILESTYDYILGNTAGSSQGYHLGIDKISGVCFEAMVKSANHAQQIDMGASRAPYASFDKC